MIWDGHPQDLPRRRQEPVGVARHPQAFGCQRLDRGAMAVGDAPVLAQHLDAAGDRVVTERAASVNALR